MLEWIFDFSNFSAVCSVLGFIFTLYLLYETKAIRSSFLRRARLPEINKELRKAVPALSQSLARWHDDRTPALEVLAHVKALLENIKPKLPGDEKKKAQIFLSLMQPRRYFFLRVSISKIHEEAAWDLYTELSGLVTALEQLAKDSRWD